MNNERRVIVTGGTKGLGRSLSLEFGEHGYDVTALYRSDDAAAVQCMQEMEGKGIRGQCLKVDLSRESHLDSHVRIEESHKFIVLINNAVSHFQPMPLHRIQWQDFETQIATTLKGSFEMVQTLIPHMIRNRQGVIVNVLTSALRQPPKGFGPYLVAKAALDGFTRVLASEYHSSGIKVFSVAPGFLNTALTEAWPERVREALGALGDRSDPKLIAQQIRKLVEETTTEGTGETHLIE